MENASLIGLSAQIALGRELDVVANNVANLNTNGFKAYSSLFEEYLSPVARANNFIGPDRRVSYVQDRATMLDLSQGPLQRTGNPLDVAIDGDAFFAVQTPQGERYTRNGVFQIDATGQLVTSDGYVVLGDAGPIVFQADDHDISINAQGTVSVLSGQNTLDAARGKLRLMSFAQPQRLQSDGSNTFTAPADVQATPASEKVRVVQGAIEKSNVRGVVEMTRLIEVSRAYTTMASLLQSESDLRKSAIQSLSEVPT
ncbi:MAG TPA: flagellar basal-body rod protein FlgF [Xanthobacteraceae bacterium]|jgi:flagellar basal-body rod protein FlgF|nr:flagellar basal-body rod protein FlgF [Xanthobacteraceae bacterium]